jgi:TonB family protein
MRRFPAIAILLALAAGTALAQQPNPPAFPEAQPDKDGAYRIGTGVGLRPPRLLNAVPADYPAAADAADGACTITLIVMPDGTPAKIHVIHSTLGGDFDARAIYAVRKSQFRAGSLKDDAVPMWFDIWVPFHADKSPAIPVTLQFGHLDSQPKVMESAELQYTDKARRAKLQGVVMITLLIPEDGVPVDLHVVRGLGMGLDEKALDAASQYRFKPGMKDGKPVPVRISMDENFRLY